MESLTPVQEWGQGGGGLKSSVEAEHGYIYMIHECCTYLCIELRGEPSVSLTQDTTLPLKQGSLALSSEISSLTTLGNRQTDTVRLTGREKGTRVSWTTKHCATWTRIPSLPSLHTVRDAHTLLSHIFHMTFGLYAQWVAVMTLSVWVSIRWFVELMSVSDTKHNNVIRQALPGKDRAVNQYR